jgi:hypothetical protein
MNREPRVFAIPLTPHPAGQTKGENYWVPPLSLYGEGRGG